MAKGRPTDDCHQRWAYLKFSIVGPLLAAPPAPGELTAELRSLSARTWKHPITGEPASFGFSTIERWYYQARCEDRDPVGALRRRVRSDRGRQTAMPEALKAVLRVQYREHPTWSYQLHADNLAARVKADPSLGPTPSYSTVRRYMKVNGLLRQKRKRRRDRPGAVEAQLRFESREVRSYEATHVGGLWHADFHEGSRKVVLPSGQWAKPVLLAVLDDRSRLACHGQWYLSEQTEDFLHGLGQAFQKRGLPRAFMTDRGSAMMAGETQAGLKRLGVLHEPTLPYSPEQNAKQEVWWAQVEGRLMACLEGHKDLTLSFLNECTQAWIEMEYNVRLHSEIGTTPVKRYLAGPDVTRPCPDSQALRTAFTTCELRTQRTSDGTLTVSGVRFEVPSRYRHIKRLHVRFAGWDLSRAWLADPATDRVICALYPLDKERNAEGRRRELEPVAGGEASTPAAGSGVAPLLAKLLDDYRSTGLPPAYLPKPDTPSKEETP